jgi:hypothetical protein
MKYDMIVLMKEASGTLFDDYGCKKKDHNIEENSLNNRII